MRSTGRTLIARIILTVLLLGALVFLIFRLITHDTEPKPQVSKASQETTSKAKQKTAEKPKAAQKPQKATPSKLPGDSASNAPATTPAPTATGTGGSATTQPAPATPAAGKDLANSGPGDVVALFIGTVAVSALIHRRFMLSRSTVSQ